MADIKKPTITELEIKMKLYNNNNVYKKDIVGFFINEQKKLLKEAAERGQTMTNQFSILRDDEVKAGFFLKFENKKYKIIKKINNMTHSDLSLIEYNDEE